MLSKYVNTTKNEILIIIQIVADEDISNFPWSNKLSVKTSQEWPQTGADEAFS